MTNKKKAYPKAEPITSPAIRRLAGKGLEAPSKLTAAEVQRLAASVEAHIEPRKKAAPKTKVVRKTARY